MTKLGAGMVAVACIAFAAAAAGIGVRASYGAQVTGDEPHYLITALSLAQDRNLDVSDEIARGAYRPFHEAPLDPQGKPLAGGRVVSPHDPLLPALLAAPAALGGWVGAKLAVAVLAALLAALLLRLAVIRFGASLGAATAAVGIFSASAPLAVYGSQIYPELPAALAMVVATTALTGRLKRAGVIAVGGAIISLPWLSVKFAPVAASLAGLALVHLWRRGDRRVALGLCGILAVAGAVFLAAHLEWYGGLTPYASGDHFVGGEFTVMGTSPSYAGRAQRLIGLLVDDKFGLVPWQPAWVLAFPALGAALARPRSWAPVMIPLGIGWLTATFVALTMQGWWFPGRQIVVVLPLVVVLIAVWASRSAMRLAWLVGLGAAGVLSYTWLVAEGTSGRLTWVVDFFRTGSPLYRALAVISPDYLSVSAETWLLQSLWLVAAIVLGYLGWTAARRDKAQASLGSAAGA